MMTGLWEPVGEDGGSTAWPSTILAVSASPFDTLGEAL